MTVEREIRFDNLHFRWGWIWYFVSRFVHLSKWEEGEDLCDVSTCNGQIRQTVALIKYDLQQQNHGFDVAELIESLSYCDATNELAPNNRNISAFTVSYIVSVHISQKCIECRFRGANRNVLLVFRIDKETVWKDDVLTDSQYLLNDSFAHTLLDWYSCFTCAFCVTQATSMALYWKCKSFSPFFGFPFYSWVIKSINISRIFHTCIHTIPRHQFPLHDDHFRWDTIAIRISW